MSNHGPIYSGYAGCLTGASLPQTNKAACVSVPPPPPVNTVVASAANRIADSATHLQSLAERLERATNRVLGLEPTAGDPSKPCNPTDAYLSDASQLDVSVERLHAAIARIEYQAGRVERV